MEALRVRGKAESSMCKRNEALRSSGRGGHLSSRLISRHCKGWHDNVPRPCPHCRRQVHSKHPKAPVEQCKSVLHKMGEHGFRALSWPNASTTRSRRQPCFVRPGHGQGFGLQRRLFLADRASEDGPTALGGRMTRSCQYALVTF